MAKQTEEVGAEFLLEIIGTVDDDEKATFDALRRFVESVDAALPGGGKKGAPSRRVKLVEAALDMIEQLLGVSNDAAQRLTNSVRKALPQFEAAARAAEKAPARKATAKKPPRRRRQPGRPPRRRRQPGRPPRRRPPRRRRQPGRPPRRRLQPRRSRQRSNDAESRTDLNPSFGRESRFREGPASGSSSAGSAMRSVRHRSDGALDDVVVGALTGALPSRGWGTLDESQLLRLFRRFCEVATESPTLALALIADLVPFTDAVSAALAERVSARPEDPEVLITSLVIAGLAHVRTQATFRHSQTATSIAALDDAVRTDVLRAAGLAAPTLRAFDTRR